MVGWPLENLRDVWANAVRKFPRKTAVIFQGQALSYAEADAQSDRIAGGLQARFGVGKGDRVAFLLPNCLEFYLAYWATVKLGAVLAPVNVRLGKAEMAYVIGNLEAKALFVHADHRREAQEALKEVEAQGQKAPPLITVGWEEPPHLSWEELLASLPSFGVPSIAPSDLAIIAHTSGTTGLPKGAMMTHETLLFNIRNTVMPLGFRHEDVHLLLVPLFHATGLYSIVPSSAYLGSTVVMAPRPDVREVLELVEQHRITTFLSVPTFWYLVTTFRERERYDLSSLRVIGYSGSPMPVQTILRLREQFPQAHLHNFYGLTETISLTHILGNADAVRKAESIGKPLPEVEAKILDEEEREVPLGEVGELCIWRGNVIPGYWRQPGRLEESLTSDGKWFRTGDLACVDEEGYFYLRGRKKEMIIVAGENVYALEVERAILEHPKVKEVAVVGVPATGARAALGELIKAVVVPREGERLTELEVKRHCAERLASYKVPHLVEFREALPRNPSGKVLKRELV